MPLASSGTEWGQPRQLSGWRWDAALLTLMCILARFRRLSVVWRVLSGPRGTSCLSCSRYSLSLARLKKPETEVMWGGTSGVVAVPHSSPEAGGGQEATSWTSAWTH